MWFPIQGTWPVSSASTESALCLQELTGFLQLASGKSNNTVAGCPQGGLTDPRPGLWTLKPGYQAQTHWVLLSLGCHSSDYNFTIIANACSMYCVLADIACCGAMYYSTCACACVLIFLPYTGNLKKNKFKTTIQSNPIKCHDWFRSHCIISMEFCLLRSWGGIKFARPPWGRSALAG